MAGVLSEMGLEMASTVRACACFLVRCSLGSSLSFVCVMCVPPAGGGAHGPPARRCQCGGSEASCSARGFGWRRPPSSCPRSPSSPRPVGRCRSSPSRACTRRLLPVRP